MKTLIVAAFAAVLLANVTLARSKESLAPRSLLGLYPPDVPSSNLLTPERATLGERLFAEPRLSLSRTRSCASCHQPAHAFADVGRFSIPDGVPAHRRNAPAVINVAYRRSLGWEGQNRTLEQQVEHSFGPYGDMGISIAEALAQIASDLEYQRGCHRAYQSSIDVECLTKSIASYERTLVSADSRFDRFLFGGEPGALSVQEQQGWILFSGRAACIDCHDVFHREVNPLGGAYATFSDERFHNLGVGYHDGITRDPGRYVTTLEPADFGSFKTPMLRNVSRTAPYMHDGSLDTLEEVVDFYNKGGIKNARQSTGIKPLFLLAEEKASLVAFLRTLDSTVPGRPALRFPIPTKWPSH